MRGKEEGQKDNQDSRDAREDIRECLQKARDFLEGRGFFGPLGALLSLLLWNGAREMAAWALMHRAERRAVALLEDEEVRAHLVRGLGELGAFPEEERVFWKERLRCALGMGDQDGQNGSHSNSFHQKPHSKSSCRKLSAEEQRALLGEFLAALYDARDTGYARLLTLHNKAAWLLLAALGLAVALGGLAPGPWPGGLDPGVAFLMGLPRGAPFPAAAGGGHGEASHRLRGLLGAPLPGPGLGGLGGGGGGTSSSGPWWRPGFWRRSWGSSSARPPPTGSWWPWGSRNGFSGGSRRG